MSISGSLFQGVQFLVTKRQKFVQTVKDLYSFIWLALGSIKGIDECQWIIQILLQLVRPLVAAINARQSGQVQLNGWARRIILVPQTRTAHVEPVFFQAQVSCSPHEWPSVGHGALVVEGSENSHL